MQFLSILGATGSIGTQTLDLVRLFPDRLKVRVLAGHRNVGLLVEQVREFIPDTVIVGSGEAARALRDALGSHPVAISYGPEALIDAARRDDVDTVVAAVVGAAGLASTLAAAEAGKRIALANKESLVVGGALVTAACARTGATLLPVDSEHSALFQCLWGEPAGGIETLTLTASGGPFRTRALDTFAHIKPEEALKHPNWSMGAKITIDSATMMNKGLEVIEAHWLFGMGAEQIDVLIHPQSIIHSMVTFKDGSVKAQLGVPSMVVPIQVALAWPERWAAPHPRVEWARLGRLDFDAPDPRRYPALGLAFDALRSGGSAPAILNAANEIAVEAFLKGRVTFTGIADTVARTLDALPARACPTLDDLLALDAEARSVAKELIPH